MAYNKRSVVIGGIGAMISMILLLDGLCLGAIEKKALKVEHITIAAGQIQNINVLPYELGLEREIYKKEGLLLEILLAKSFVTLASLNNGNMDYSITGGTAFRAIAAGLPIKSVMSNRSRAGMHIVGKPGINSVKDLKGKVIAVSQVGETPDYYARVILRSQGLDPDRDVVMRSVGPGAMTYQALKMGTVDAGMMNIVHFLRLHEEKRGFKELMSVDEVWKGVSQNIIAPVKKLKENPEQIKKMIRATLRSIAYVKENSKESIDFMVNRWGLEKNLASALYDREVDGFNNNGKVPDEAFHAEIKEAQDRGLLSPHLKVPITQLRDYSLLEEVLKEMGIK